MRVVGLRCEHREESPCVDTPAPRLGWLLADGERQTFERDGAAAWADAGVIVPWLMWWRYGDVRFVERHWDAMERYMDYLLRNNPDLLWTARRGNDYGSRSRSRRG